MAKERAGAKPPVPAWRALVLVCIGAVALRLQALRAPFFADDFLFLDQVRWRSLVAAIAAPDPIGNFFRPASRALYFWLVTRAFGESPLAFHMFGLALLVVTLVLLFAIGRRLASERAGLIAASILALHYAADVPVRWASGSQDLLAVVGSLATIWLFISGHRILAGVTMLIAALSKETALVTPLIAVALAGIGGSWRRTAFSAWPLGAALGVWAALWLAWPQRHASAGGIALDPGGTLAALVHLVQVAIGLEWRAGGLPAMAVDLSLVVALVLVSIAVALAFDFPGRRDRGANAAVWSGLAWALLATAPIVAVAAIWSAYYYLFAMCGVALALGVWLAARPRAWAVGAVVLLACGSASGRALDEFAVVRSPWTWRSHINSHYLERATHSISRYLDAMQRGRPSFPPRSVVFFGGLKGSIGFQAADGPLLRWAYRDSSLRSYYVSEFTRDKVARGPVFLFVASGDTLMEEGAGADFLAEIAVGAILGDRLPAAREALELERERKPPSPVRDYTLAWVEWSLGDTTSARRLLAGAGVGLDDAGDADRRRALGMMSAGDTLGARAIMETSVLAHALDPATHALLADLSLMLDSESSVGTSEAFATRVLAPRDPFAWRRWGMVQAQRERYRESLDSFQRYFDLAGESGSRDLEAKRWVERIRSVLPGGGAQQEGLRE